MKIAIVLADYYADISKGLLTSCCEKLSSVNAQYDIFRISGALEIPLALQKIANDISPSGMVALGCVIRGQSYHFEIVSHTSAVGILQVQLQTGIPIGNGILTVENHEQALSRLDKGKEAVEAMMSLMKLEIQN